MIATASCEILKTTWGTRIRTILHELMTKRSKVFQEPASNRVTEGNEKTRAPMLKEHGPPRQKENTTGRLQFQKSANGIGWFTGLHRSRLKRRAGWIPVLSRAALPLYRHRCKP